MAACMFIIVVGAVVCGYFLGLHDFFSLDKKFPKWRKRFDSQGFGVSDEDL